MPGWFIHNGKFHHENELVISPDNRSFRYGDGLFETIRLHNNQLSLWDLHQQRLFSGLDKLSITTQDLFTPDRLLSLVKSLATKNNLTYARVRITVYRGGTGLTDDPDQPAGFLIQTWPAPHESVSLNSNGLHIGVYTEAKKPMDSFSALKSNNFLPYVQAVIFAKKQKWNDALILNTSGRIADSAIANIFWVKDGRIFTTPLSEGPISGVMRRYLLENALIHEKPLSTEELLQAEEIFLTNAFRGIQWVSLVEGRQTDNNQTSAQLHQQLVRPLFS